MATASLVAKITTEGAARAKTQLKLVSNQAKETGTNTEKMGDEFDKSSTKSKTLTSSLSKLKSPLIAVGVAAAAVVTVIGSLALATSDLVVENKNMAALAGQTVADFQAMSFAAAQFGITNETLSDQFKDVNEKIGEFLTTGGGGFQDYLDVMRIGTDEGKIFARSVRDISGQDALGIMITNMEAAGKTTKEMSFAVEGLASDLTKSLPLFLNNSKALKGFTSEFSRVTNPLSDEDTKLYVTLSKNVDLAAASFGSLVENSLVPTLKSTNDLTVAMTYLFASLNTGTEANLTSRISDLVEEIAELGAEAENGAEGWIRFSKGMTFSTTTAVAAESRIESLKVELEKLREEYTTSFGAAPVTPVTDVDTSTSTTAQDIEDARIATLKLRELEKENAIISAELKVTAAEEQKQAYIDDFAFYDNILQLKAESEKAALDASILSFEETNSLIQSAGSALSSSLATGFGDLISGASSAKEVAIDLVESIAGSVLQSGIDVLIQSQITDRIAGAAFLAHQTAESASTTAQAGLNAFASTAAIPVVGPALAPAAAVAATAAAGALSVPVVAAAAAREQGGQFTSGQDLLVGERGREIVSFGTSGRVTNNSDTNKALSNNSASNSVTLTVIDQSSGNKEYSQETKSDGEIILLIRNTVSADIATPNTQIDKSLSGRGNLRSR